MDYLENLEQNPEEDTTGSRRSGGVGPAPQAPSQRKGVKLTGRFASMLAKRSSELSLRESATSPSPAGLDASPSPGFSGYAEGADRHANSALSRFQEPVSKSKPIKPEMYAESYDIKHLYLK